MKIFEGVLLFILVIFAVIVIQLNYKLSAKRVEYEELQIAKLKDESNLKMLSNTIVSVVRTNISIQYVTNYWPVYVENKLTNKTNAITMIYPNMDIVRNDPWLYVNPEDIKTEELQTNLETMLNIAVEESKKKIEDRIKLIESLRNVK